MSFTHSADTLECFLCPGSKMTRSCHQAAGRRVGEGPGAVGGPAEPWTPLLQLWPTRALLAPLSLVEARGLLGAVARTLERTVLPWQGGWMVPRGHCWSSEMFHRPAGPHESLSPGRAVLSSWCRSVPHGREFLLKYHLVFEAHVTHACLLWPPFSPFPLARTTARGPARKKCFIGLP